MKTIGFLIFSFLFISISTFAQKEDYVWRLGDKGGINFNNGYADTFSVVQKRHYTFDALNASTCDTAGNLLFFTNGAVIFNAYNDTLLNGDNLNPSLYTSAFSQTGLTIPQGDIALRKPGSSNIYYLFHETLNDNAYKHTYALYYSVIDMSLDSGKGGVLNGKKNLHLYDDTLMIGKLSAIRHANGRDWWIMSKKACYPLMLEWLFTPDTIMGPFTIPLVNDPNACADYAPGQACYSPSGDKFAITFRNQNKSVYAFNVDRCTGNLTEIFHTQFVDSNFFAYGCAFSANSRFLYVGLEYHLYQFDMTAPNVAASKTLVALNDNYLCLGQHFWFSFMRLAPDNKIYIAPQGGCNRLTVIESPDSAGLSCNVKQHSFVVPALGLWGVPNIPDYKVGKIAESPCDTITSAHDLRAKENMGLSVYPNPFYNKITLQPFNGSAERIIITVFNDVGEVVYTKQSTLQMQEIDLSGLAGGVYLLQVQGKEERFMKRIVKL